MRPPALGRFSYEIGRAKMDEIGHELSDGQVDESYLSRRARIAAKTSPVQRRHWYESTSLSRTVPCDFTRPIVGHVVCIQPGRRHDIPG